MESTNLIAVKEFCVHHGVEHSYLISLHDFGFIQIEKDDYIKAEELSRIEKIMRFHREMDINFEGIEVILNLLDRVERQDRERHELKNLLRFYEE